MPDPHYLIPIRPGSHLEIGVGKRVSANDQAMIARRFEGVRQAPKNAKIVVMNRRRLSMHDAEIADDFAAEYMAYALMAQAHAKCRNTGCEMLN